MATTTSNMDIAPQVQEGIPAWLDFNALRSAAIAYLGPVTGSLWTDYNVHDPGITTLEALIYGILDLGYRTHLPLSDILARDPAQQGGDPDFFTPGEILVCNPLTLLDYRKLLQDIEGVRNAWVEVDTTPPNGINGLYQVYIELDKTADDFTTTAEYTAYQEQVLCLIRQALMAHRNLCEDFLTVYFLCYLDVGVCADIELASGTDPGTCYQQLITALYAFFSPTPTFYTLQQMLARKVPMEDIFAGRPYAGGASHGFLDTAELQAITRLKEIHVSDVYKTILGVPGVQRIRKLQLRTCPDAGAPVALSPSCWVLTLPANTLPVLSIPCGGFQFYQNGQPLKVDLSVYNSLLELNLTKSGKVLYPAGSPYLDASVPKGLFRSDLGTYYSIQNDFPQVYGIGQGSLPANAPALRIAQARQFKGFLLFFDQLLADYLAQLSNIRELFALGSSGCCGSPGAGSAADHTYFIGDVSSVPDVAALLRFPGTGGAAAGPAAGTILAYPVAAASWAPFGAAGTISCNDLSSLGAYSFGSAADRDTAIDQLTIDLTNLMATVTTVTIGDTGGYLYVIALAGYEYVLLAAAGVPDAVSAAQQAGLVLFLGQDTENYSRTNTALAGSYGFAINQSGKSYLDYLQTILEDGETARQRRTMFLNHLLARFAEVFTDYALLYLGNTQDAVFEQRQIMATERFLGCYPGLSANRGKAMNYLRPGWNDDNISGLERRFKAFTGIKDWTRHHLCNFEVVQNEPGYILKLMLGGAEWFVSKSSFAKEESEQAAVALAGALGWTGNYQVVQPPDDLSYALDVRFFDGGIARSVKRWGSEEAARADMTVMANLWSAGVRAPDIRISRYEYYIALLDSEGQVVRYSREAYGSEEQAQEGIAESLAHPQDEKIWEYAAGVASIGTLLPNKLEGKRHQYLDIQGFNISPDHDVPNKPGRWRFKVLDTQNTFTLLSIDDFAQQEEAWDSCIRFLYGLVERVSYGVRQDDDTGLFKVLITVNGKVEAISDPYFVYHTRLAAVEAGETMLARARAFVYEVDIRPVPDRWRFYYTPGTSMTELFPLVSSAEYESTDATETALRAFVAGSKDWQVKGKRNAPVLMMKEIGCEPVAGGDDTMRRSKLETLVALKQQAGALVDGEPKAIAPVIVPDARTLAGTYVYRLVDKDHPKARCPRGMSTPAAAETLRKALVSAARKRYPFLEICLGGDRLVLGPAGSAGAAGAAGSYYFQIKCRNHYFESRGIPGRDIVLFESVQGYASPADAQTAFSAQYLNILAKGMDAANYGPGKWISLEEREDIHQDGSPRGLIPQVLVPKESQERLGIMGKNPIMELCLACATYPVRFVQPRVLIDPCTGPVVADPCTSPAATPLYGFVLFNISTDELDWESIGDFTTPEDAMEAFYFILMLLAWPGNLFIRLDERDCLYYVKIREVLAESVQTFLTADAAWGIDGVEKFIGVTQGPHGFHLFVRGDNCGNTFWVGCPDCRLEHPCKYDTPEKQDMAQAKLLQGYQAFKDRDWLAGLQNKGREGAGTLYGLNGEPLAVLPERLLGNDVLDVLLDIVDAAWIDARYKPGKDGSPTLEGADGVVLAQAVPGFVSSHWKKELQAWVYYFPLSRKTQEKGGVITRHYAFAVKLPDFPALQEAPPYFMPCGCGPEPAPCTGPCYTGWRNHLTYVSATQAWEAYLSAFPMLGDASAYRPVFDCCCSSFSIELCPGASVIAANPQSYYLPDEACAAVERAKGLINAEGLELVEHILLRPCPGEPGIPVCKGDTKCDTTWIDINKQGALESPPLGPFTPGADPYSFIATVVLPAWPLRFSKPENRLQLETILQREAPAHILLRILWLCPHELCRFEAMYKKWEYWLSGQTNCSGYDQAAFVRFLFETQFPCSVEPEPCCPTVSVDPSGPCWAGTSVPVTQGSQDWLSEINLLYCWADMECAKTVPPPDPQEISKLVNRRLSGYRSRVQEIIGGPRHPVVAGRVQAFMTNLEPAQQAFEKLAAELAAARKKAGKTGKEKIRVLAESVAGYWFDLAHLKTGRRPGIDEARELLTRLGLSAGEAERFYRNWNT